ncbi:hypothetical protein [Salipiger sp. PrR002]|uniref:hypothetical protein n=1 Tax=Salipiger sp. PrR002 TaxID=2706489 RepID=UPI0013BDD8C9|nr:hypothetical protein [Salipiger sp. PrR002]NDW02023.1 hypothetical protein [Salipiger sp. PrR002]NDW59139.1 hypothetical protein [Salipiger sp. PrR004]
MLQIPRAAFFLSAVVFCVTETSSAQAAENARAVVDNDAVAILTCPPDGQVISIVGAEIQRREQVGPCLAAYVPWLGQKYILAVVNSGGEPNVRGFEVVATGEVSFIQRYEKLILFVLGMAAATIGSLAAAAMSPLKQYVVLHIKFRRSRDALLLAANEFERDYEISQELKKVASGKFTANYLISRRFLERCRKLVRATEEWHSEKITGAELSARIKNL